MNTNTVQAKKSRVSTRTLVQIAMLAAVAVVLRMFEIPVWFAPSFYKIDLSELPVLVGTFAMGPVAGCVIGALKELLYMLISGSATAGVGELANFLVVCAFVAPAGVIYKKKKTRKRAIVGMAVGTLCRTVVGCVLNAYVLLPAYGKAFGMPVASLIEMGTAVNGAVTDMFTFVMLVVAPFNLLKGAVISVITLLIYKFISPLLHGNV